MKFTTHLKLDKNRLWLYFIVFVAFCFYVACILFRTDGVNGDEAGYLSYARTSIFGDTPLSGKPPLFYIFNFFVLNHTMKMLGRLEPLGLLFFYAAAMSVSSAFLAKRLSSFLRAESFLWAYLLILLNPLIFYHGVHVMMESILLVLLNLILGCLFSVPTRGDSRALGALNLSVLAISTILIIPFKETSLPALVILTLILGMSGQRIWKYLFFSMLAGLALRWLENHNHWVPTPPHGITYAVMPDLKLISLKFGLVSSLSWLWAFIIGPVALIAAIAGYFQGSLSRPVRNAAVLGIFLCACAGLVISTISALFIAPRYAFPVLWVASVGVLLIGLSGRKWFKFAMLAALLVPLISFFSPSPGKMKLWPGIFADDMYRNGAVVFAGVPIFSWIASSLPASSQPVCVVYSMRTGDMNYYVQRFIGGFLPNAVIVDSSDLKTKVDPVQMCGHHILEVYREYRPDAGVCDLHCVPGFKTACSVQSIDSFSDHHYSVSDPGLLTSGACFEFGGG